MPAKTKWTEGLSATSIGRFGGITENYVHQVNGFLACSAGVNELYAGADLSIHLGRYEPGKPWLAESSADWTCMRHEMKSRSGKTLATVYQSLLSPAVCFDVRQNRFLWFNDRSAQILTFFYPTKQGVQQIRSSVPFEAHLSEPWMLGLAEAHDRRQFVPLLFVFQHCPQSVRNINSDYHEFDFARRAGRVAVMPLLGPARPKLNRRDIHRGLTGELGERCRFWAQSLLAYPVGCREDFRIDEANGRVEIRNRIRYLAGANDWSVEPRYLAPVPPVLAMAHQKGYPIRFDAELVDTGMRTYYGPLLVVEGKTLSYSIPRLQWLDKTIAPVRVANSAKFDKLQQSLAAYIAKPTDTFGGDSTYDETNIQDVLHNLRILGWATWSLDEPDRKRLAKLWLGRMKAFRRGNYKCFTERFTGRSFWAERDIWREMAGEVTYDYEWYNGMQLAGLWAGRHFLDQPARFDRILRDKWDLVEDVGRYFSLFNDWATGTVWTDVVGEFMWMDGFHYAWQGMIGFYRLARELGHTDRANEMAYLASKSAIPRWVSWRMNDYVDESIAAGLSVLRRPADPGMGRHKFPRASLIVGGFHEREGFCLSSNFSPHNALGYMVPEQWLFYRADPLIRRRLADGQDRHLAKHLPQWNRRPEFGRGKGWLYPSHWHFYQLDDQLFVRSMVLRRPVEELLKLTKDLTGPTMEAALVAAAPMAIIPTDARFAGNDWDARVRTLRVRLDDCSRPGMELTVVWPDKPASVQGAEVVRFDARAGELVLRLPKGRAEVVLAY